MFKYFESIKVSMSINLSLNSTFNSVKISSNLLLLLINS
jgi:hypothetical protein